MLAFAWQPGSGTWPQWLPSHLVKVNQKTKPGGSTSPILPHVRTIPTRVGKTRVYLSSDDDTSSDHPHAGGENASSSSSAVVQPLRTIPTRVGRTLTRRRRRSRLTDHPHAGGENRSFIMHANSDRGPSPRGWGELVDRPLVVRCRTIPTRVGRTGRSDQQIRSTTDHPHAGGENPLCTFHARCTDHPHAGGENSLSGAAASSLYTDHPHAGGENAYRRCRRTIIGPSPRGWGEQGIELL